MAFLDFIKYRQSGQQQPVDQSAQQPKPETAKEMYSRQAELERTGQKSVQQMPVAEKSQASALGARLDKATQHIQQNAPSQTPAPADGTSGPEPMRQNMTGQDKAAPNLSPTSAQMGQTANEKTAAAPSQGETGNTQQPGRQTSQTMARRPPSWER
jgi:hypothetical protein